MSVSSRDSFLARARRRIRGAVPARPSHRPASTDSVPTYPEVVLERTNLGPEMDRRVWRAKRNQQPLGIDPDYDLLRENFDYLNYLLEAQVSGDGPGLDPVRHFLRKGAEAVNSPDYNFAMPSYLERYPEKLSLPERSPYLDWLKRGRAADEIADPAQGIEMMAGVLGLGPGQIVDELVASRTDMMQRLRTGELGRMFAKAAEIEPLIGEQWGETTRTRMIPLGGRFVVGQVAALHACHVQAGFKRARVVIVVDRPRSGSDRTFESHIAHALAAAVAAEDVVVVYTDEGGTASQGWLPAGVREIDFASASAGLPDEHRQQALAALLRSFESEAIINVGSRALYSAFAPYGKALAASERIFLVFTSNVQRPGGSWDGWSLRWFYASTDFAAGIITDSEHMRDQISEMYQLSEDDLRRIHVFRTPVDTRVAPVAPAPEDGASRRPVVHWAGRKTRRMRMDIALEVARRMPDVDFLLWDEGEFHRSSDPQLPENVRLEPMPGRVSDLDLSQADAWLYTAAWAGVPSLLLDVAMTEVPIVAGLVGGVGEVLTDEDAWPVTEQGDPGAYEMALRQIISEPTLARQRSRALRERLARDRTAPAYLEHAVSILLDGTGAARTGND